MILPGETLGMLGGGQLGRMFTVAARTLGYRVLVLDPDAVSPAGVLADQHLHAPYTDTWALDQMAKQCAAVTTEFENVPGTSLRSLASHVPVRPGAMALEMTQDRAREKRMIHDAGLATAPFRVIDDAAGVGPAFEAIGAPAILKRASMGYDGKGQVPVHSAAQAQHAFADLGDVPCVLERRIDLEREISVILARAEDGSDALFPVAENIHRDGILHMSIAPARICPQVAAQACDMARHIARTLDYCGLMGVEFFLTTQGELLVNEVAPRTHNSGHFTLDACVTSQFEQQVRTVCGLPFGDTRLLSPVVMVNLLGDLWQNGRPDWSTVLAHPNVKLHLYGKNDARPGRKMGHFCVLDEDLDRAISLAQDIFSRLQSG